MCGIFGGLAHPGKKLNLHKLIILGLYNVSRGTDSCGYYYNGNIEKGTYQYSNFINYISSHYLVPGDLEHDIFLGHTRKSTAGANNEENAHPHIVNDCYVQAHNGVLENHWKLCTKYDIRIADIPIDSIALANLIYKEGFKVLNEYVGFAALAMTSKDNPDKLYLYKGASKQSKNGNLVEERPLYVARHDEGFYYSSMQTSLSAIDDHFVEKDKLSKDEIISYQYEINDLEPNVVFELHNGDIKPVYKVERSENNVKEEVKVIHHVGFNSQNDSQKQLLLRSGTSDPILLESNVGVPANSNKVYYRKGRYYRCADQLLNGRFLITPYGFIMTNVNVNNAKEYYFYEGILMKSEEDYKKALALNIDKNENIAFHLSKFSKYPLFNLENESSNILNENRYRWWFNEKVVINALMKPFFSHKTYNIENGITKSIVCNNGNGINPIEQ